MPSKEEAVSRTKMMLDVYTEFAEKYLAIPVIKGEKTPSERFPGAVDTLCIEAMMQDRKALQAGTSHFLGQNFAKASEIRFQSDKESEEYAWTTSWGVSTRLIGGLIMCHGDDDGIILPPKVASSHVVLLPIIRKEADRQNVMEYCERLKNELSEIGIAGETVSVEIDDRDIGGARGWDWIKKGIPIRAEIGPRDIAEDSVFMARRDKPHKEKMSVKRDVFTATISDILNEIQHNLYEKALSFKQKNTLVIDDQREFYQFFTPENKEKPEIHGGFAMSHWCGSLACEEKIKDDLMVTIRCIPFDGNVSEKGKCICCGEDSSQRVVYAKSY